MKRTHVTVTSLNVNGMRATVRHGFQKWRARQKTDVYCLQELRIQPDQMQKEHCAPRGWSVCQMDAEKKGYSGVAIWTRLPVIRQSLGCGLDWADREGRMVRMDLEDLTVVSLYLPSGSSGDERQALKESFMDYFLEVTQGLLDEGRPTVICGDFNIAHTPQDIHNPTGNKKNSGFLPHEREWMTGLLEQGWVDVFRALNPDSQVYSWWSNRGQARAKDRGWRIDYQIATPDLAARAEEAWIEGPDRKLSDHAPVSVRYRL